jgi:hypothetical protein
MEYDKSSFDPAKYQLPRIETDPFPSDLLASNQRQFCYVHKDVKVGEEHTFWSSSLLPVHGTSLKNATSILKDGAIKPYSKLVEENAEATRDTQKILTDTLDIELGLHQYAFFNLGRLHPIDIHEVYFIFKSEIIQSPSTVVSHREIANFGAHVSKEAEAFVLKHRKGATQRSIEKDNQIAIERFFKQCFEGDVFQKEIFPRFLAKNYPSINQFWVSETYPGVKLQPELLGNTLVPRGAWEGPQVMVKDGVQLADKTFGIFVPALTNCRDIVRTLVRAGFDADQIFTLSEASDLYRSRFRQLNPSAIPFDHAFMCRMALRDIALLERFNPYNQSFPDSMNAYRNRIR